MNWKMWGPSTHSIQRLIVLSALVVSANGVLASENDTAATSESRDASTAYLGTSNFVVGRVGRECLNLLGRTESPQTFVGAWQQRNVTYLMATQKYMAARFREAEAIGGVNSRNAVANALNSAVRNSAEVTVKSWLDRPDKQTACKRAVELIESGAFDVSTSTPMYKELEALVAWAQR
jgi:hypothetical protein